jgi:hypothetical protein
MRSVSTLVVDLVAELERLIDARNQASVPYEHERMTRPMSSPSTSATTTPDVDMSPEAVERRLQEVVALNRLCASLMDAGKAAGLHDRVWDSGPPAPSNLR